MARSCDALSPILFLCVLSFAAGATAHADVIESSAPIQGISGGGYLGQELAIPIGPDYNNITFSFVSGQSYAIGTGYLLTQPFLGLPGSLGSATGLVASAVATGAGGSSGEGNVYAFGSSTTLLAGQNYYFYEDAPIPTFPYPSGGGSVAGGYYTGYPSYGTISTSEDFTTLDSIGPAFNLTGDPIVTASSVTPELPSWSLVGTGLLCMAGMIRKRLA